MKSKPAVVEKTGGAVIEFHGTVHIIGAKSIVFENTQGTVTVRPERIPLCKRIRWWMEF